VAKIKSETQKLHGINGHGKKEQNQHQTTGKLNYAPPIHGTAKYIKSNGTTDHTTAKIQKA
jgi:hypothetical protein